ncbi:pseudouridine synthase [uncultured Duncaniella sp.]|uniref:pseudouridine synthase n=1 Tax=uncultured Duncaniella sp. TaxID=2768039 RepID=UPI0025B1B017|nr:pseudouridine synthase [uncultured Duncaniella sp.]
MDSNEKKGKRPRIGSRPYPVDSHDNGRENTSGEFTSGSENNSEGQHEHQNSYNNNSYGERLQRPYQPRPYNNRQGGYQNNRYGNQGGYQNNRYGNQGGYNRQGGYQPRPHVPQTDGAPVEGAEGESSRDENSGSMNGGYQPRNNYNRQQGGYQPRQQGGYQPRQQGGYQPRQQGGYQPRQQGGYQPRQQGGYQNNRQGGYQNKGPRQNQYGMPQGGRSFTPRPKRIEYETPLPDPNEQVRLNKYMANAGLCSRREADEFILQGLIKVNGEVVTELGTKISHSDVVEYDEKVVTLEKKCYILLNKPKDCVTTSDDPNGRLTVMDLVKGACNERIYPVGRLDRNTTGVLLLTNDGDLASKLTHPKFVKKKIYHVWTDHDITEDDMQRIADGIELEDGPIHADAISYATDTDRNQAGIEIHSGRNRIVRRIFESLGYHVTKLDRVYFAGLTKKNLPRGRWRYLTQEEVNYLKMGSFE